MRGKRGPYTPTPENRRVLSKRDGSLGTAVMRYVGNRYKVLWDEPTPYQDEARVPIPSEDFEWA